MHRAAVTAGLSTGVTGSCVGGVIAFPVWDRRTLLCRTGKLASGKSKRL